MELYRKIIDLIGMRLMEDRIFVDTNLLIYYVSDEIQKKQIVRDLLLSAKSVSVRSQVINEFVAVSLKKKINPVEETVRFAREFIDLFEVSAVAVSSSLNYLVQHDNAAHHYAYRYQLG